MYVVPSVHNCTRDEGGPLGVGLQEQASSRLKLLWSKAMVVSVEEKSWHETVAGVDQGDERERSADEVSKVQLASKPVASRTPG